MTHFLPGSISSGVHNLKAPPNVLLEPPDVYMFCPSCIIDKLGTNPLKWALGKHEKVAFLFEELREAPVRHRPVHPYHDGLRIEDAIGQSRHTCVLFSAPLNALLHIRLVSYVKAEDPSNYDAEVIEIANRAGRRDDLVRCLQMALKMLREPKIERVLIIASTISVSPTSPIFLTLARSASMMSF